MNYSLTDAIVKVESILPENKTEEFIKNEIIIYLNDPDLMDEDFTGRLFHIIDEAHDGAYDPEETSEPFTDDEAIAFCIKYQLLIKEDFE